MRVLEVLCILAWDYRTLSDHKNVLLTVFSFNDTLSLFELVKNQDLLSLEYIVACLHIHFPFVNKRISIVCPLGRCNSSFNYSLNMKNNELIKSFVKSKLFLSVF